MYIQANVKSLEVHYKQTFKQLKDTFKKFNIFYT